MSGDLKTTCCVVGGGPAGMMLAYLLARAGIEVVLLEKHADFFRDFRGDTIHPSTMEALSVLGLDEKFLELKPDELHELVLNQDGERQRIADFSHLELKHKFVAFIPQWDFLNFLAKEAAPYPSFHLEMEAEGNHLIQENGKVVGVQVQSPQGDFQVHADLVVGTDGRHSTIRQEAGLPIHDFGAPIDVLWLRIPKGAGQAAGALGNVAGGQFLVLLDRKTYYQAGYLIRKGQFDAVKAAGLPAFRESLRRLAPAASEGIDTIQDWDQVKLLTVRVDRLEKWFLPGLLCIGDSAHAMSPVGGVGINLAIQDAIAAANMLIPKLRDHDVTEADLKAVQERRERPAQVIQRMQVLIHRRAFGRTGRFPIPIWLLRAFPFIGRMVAKFIGVGVLPEYPDLAVIDQSA